MFSLTQLEEKQSLIERETTKKHKTDLQLCRSGLNLLFEVFTLLENTEFLAGRANDYRLVIWGYLGTTTSTLAWYFDAACKGQYRIAMILVRVLIEETVTSRYFLRHPGKASQTIEQATQDLTPRVRFEPDIYKKFKAIGLGPSDSLYRLFSQVSDRFS